MFRIAVVEDNQQDTDRLCACLERFSSERNMAFHVDCFERGTVFLEKFRSDYDIVFMDIELPHKNGMETAREMRKKDQQVLLVFVTNLAQYAIQGYEVNAFDYILKPINYYSLFLKLQRLMIRAAGQSRDDEIAIRSERTTVRLNLRTVQYIEADGHYVKWHTKPRIYQSLDALKTLEQRLPKYFCALNRWVIVNLNYVDYIDGNDIRIGDAILQVSRYRKQEFLKKFAEHMVGGAN